MTPVRRIFTIFALAVLCAPAIFAQLPANLRGQVTDPSGAVIFGASVTVTAPNGDVRTANTGTDGSYSLTGLTPGMYRVRIAARGFTSYERSDLEFLTGRTTTVDVKLVLASAQQEITVTDSVQVEVDPLKNAGATVLQGQDLEMLSDDPDDLENDLQALAGPAAGPNGGQIFVDGFSNGQLPPKSSILEIRINSNPFSAEFDKIGFGRVEILTKPGTDHLHGTAFVDLDSGALDSRNPFAQTRPSFLTRQYQGNLAGSLNKKTSFFVDFSHRLQDEQGLVVATILDSNFLPRSYRANIPEPVSRTSVSPRMDYQLTPNVTLQARYTYTGSENQNYAVGQFFLPSEATTVNRSDHSAQFTETWIANPTSINESRFQYTNHNVTQVGASTGPSIIVSGAFTGGPPVVGDSYVRENNFEFQNYTTLTRGAHLIKFGARIRGALQGDNTDQYFNGAFSYAALTTLDCPDLSTCHAYAPTAMGIAQGLSMAQIIANGGGPSQYTRTIGNPFVTDGQMDAAPFVQDDWRVIPNVTLSMGLRYELQNNIGDWHDIAPRIGLAWGLGGGQGRNRQPKTVVRAGFGIFYDRFQLDNVVNTVRLNGTNQLRFLLNSPQFACIEGGGCAGAVPAPNQLASTLPLTVYRMDSGMQAPQSIQSAIGLERQLPKSITLSLNYTNTRGVHQLRSRNINAPYPATYNLSNPASGVYPMGNPNPIDQYESSSMFKQNQLTVNINARMSPKYTLFGYYNYGHAHSNTDGLTTFPTNTYDESPDWGRAQFDIRQRLFIGGNVTAPFGLRFAPMILLSSAPPFNIVVGQDLNGDGQSNDRPSYASALSNPANVIHTAYGDLNLRPLPGETLIPRNLGDGFGNLTINLRVSRTWGFGEAASGAAPAGPRPAGGGFGGGRPGARPAGGGGGFFGGGGGGAAHRYNFTLSAEFRNLLNSVNPAAPVGILSSNLFGTSQSVAGGFGGGGNAQTANRRVQLQLRFTF